MLEDQIVAKPVKLEKSQSVIEPKTNVWTEFDQAKKNQKMRQDFETPSKQTPSSEVIPQSSDKLWGNMEFKKAPVIAKKEKVVNAEDSLGDMLVIASGQQKKKKRKVM